MKILSELAHNISFKVQRFGWRFCKDHDLIADYATFKNNLDHPESIESDILNYIKDVQIKYVIPEMERRGFL